MSTPLPQEVKGIGMHDFIDCNLIVAENPKNAESPTLIVTSAISFNRMLEIVDNPSSFKFNTVISTTLGVDEFTEETLTQDNYQNVNAIYRTHPINIVMSTNDTTFASPFSFKESSGVRMEVVIPNAVFPKIIVESIINSCKDTYSHDKISYLLEHHVQDLLPLFLNKRIFRITAKIDSTTGLIDFIPTELLNTVSFDNAIAGFLVKE